MRRLLQNRLFVAVLLVAMAAAAALNWYRYLAAKGATAARSAGPVAASASSALLTETAVAGAAEAWLQIRAVDGETVAQLGGRLGLDAERTHELEQLNRKSMPADPRLVLLPSRWFGELRVPRDPFLWPEEEPAALSTENAQAPRISQKKNKPIPIDVLLKPDDGNEQLEVLVEGLEQGGGALSVAKRVIRVGERVSLRNIPYTVVGVFPGGAVLRDDLGVERRLSFRPERKKVTVEVAGESPAGSNENSMGGDDVKGKNR